MPHFFQDAFQKHRLLLSAHVCCNGKFHSSCTSTTITPFFLHLLFSNKRCIFSHVPLIQTFFKWFFQFILPSFCLSTELLADPSIHKQAAVGEVQASRGTEAASQSRLHNNCRYIMPYCQGQQLTAGDRAPDVGAIWFPVATGISGME